MRRFGRACGKSRRGWVAFPITCLSNGIREPIATSRCPSIAHSEVYRQAISAVSGLARSARGPVMSALPGKVMIDGVVDVGSVPAFVLSFIQARDPSWCKRPFFADFDPMACWLTGLRPAFGATEFFYEQGLREELRRCGSPTASTGHFDVTEAGRGLTPLPV